MALIHSPNIVTNGLVLCLDAASKQSYNQAHNLMFYSGLQGASGTNLPTGYGRAQDMASAVAPSNNTSITVDGVGYWQFDLVGTTPVGNGNQLLVDSTTFITGIKPAASYTITYNYAFLSSANISGDGISRNYADIGGISVVILWYDTNNTLLSYSSQNNDSNNLSFWQRSSATGKSSFTAVAPANAVKAKLRFAFYNPVAGGTSINWVGFRLGGIQFEERNSSGTYVATTTSQVLPSTSWNDISGNANNGTIIGSPTFNATNGGSIVFTASTADYVNLTSASLLPVGTSDRTIIAFVRTPTSFPYSYLHVIHWGTANTSEAFGMAIFNNGGLNSHPWAGAPTQGTVATGTNYCLAITYTNSSTLHRFWINGVSQGAGVARAINTGTTTARVGSRIDVPQEQWGPDGRIYNVIVYNRALSEQEIQQNFNAMRGRFGL